MGIRPVSIREWAKGLVQCAKAWRRVSKRMSAEAKSDAQTMAEAMNFVDGFPWAQRPTLSSQNEFEAHIQLSKNVSALARRAGRNFSRRYHGGRLRGGRLLTFRST